VWNEKAYKCRSADRNHRWPKDNQPIVGFRVVLDTTGLEIGKNMVDKKIKAKGIVHQNGNQKWITVKEFKAVKSKHKKHKKDKKG
jgi:hypothetical protein